MGGTKQTNDFDVINNVKEYYGKVLKNSDDLKTGACCSIDSIPDYIKEVLPLINDEIKDRYYGCGSPIPLLMKGLRVLDVGCGTGRDSYIMSKLAGDKGFVYGIDMTKNQLDIAKKYIEEQTTKYGYKEANVEFILDNIENIPEHIAEQSLDLVTSNCVLNLLEDKGIILKQIYRVLREGGEFYFSDIYSDRRIPRKIKEHKVLYGECMGGALYYNDFKRLALEAGFTDPRVVDERPIAIDNKELELLVGNIKFISTTYRLWKIGGLENRCEDYGHMAIYKGGVPEAPFSFRLDKDHVFEKNKPERVCGNTALMLKETRFRKYFKIIGDFKEHFGEFKECGNSGETEDNEGLDSGCC